MYKLFNVIRDDCLHQSVIFWLAIHSTTIHMTAAMMAHVNYQHHKMAEKTIPDELNITLYTEYGNSSQFHLKRVQHIDPNVPVYTYNVDKDGRYISKREQMEVRKNIGYYQDIGNEAVIQLTRTNNLKDEMAQYVLKGELNISGKKYTLNPETRVKRDKSQSAIRLSQISSGETYRLQLQTTSPVNIHRFIEPPPEIKRTYFEAARLDVPTLHVASISSNTPLLPKSTSSLPPSSKRSRRESQDIQNYYVDIVAVADNAVYRRFLTGGLESRTDVLQAIREYYAFLFNGDLRYKSIASVNYIINVRLIKVIIAETAAASNFTEKFRVSSRPWDEVDAQSVLAAFSEFVAGSSSDILSPYDHAVLFTGFDLTSSQTGLTITNATTGLAFTSTLCRTDGKSVSVVEDLGGFQAVDTAAHELGHSLSARHDGDGNTCLSSDRYVMASGSSQVTQSNKYNPWLFSPCSIASFTDFISNSIQTTRGQTCLTVSLSISDGIPDVSNRLPGQEFPPDEQCRMIYGSNSRLCRGTEFASVASVCTSMFCFDPNTVGTCYEQTAAIGTTCGNGMLCLNGQCVLDSRAPAVDDSCVFGDQPGNAFDNMTCPDFINSYNGYCYQALVRGRCCRSCHNIYSTVTGCEYGDKVRGCTAKVCSFATASYLEQCCGTCSQSYTFTLPTLSSQALNTDSISYPSADSLTTAQAMTSTSILHIDPGICEDNPNILVNDLSCADVAATNPRFCYQIDVSIACCASCGEANTGVAGTEIDGQEENEGINGEKVEAEEVKIEDEEQDEQITQNHHEEDKDENVEEEEETDREGQEEDIDKEVGVEREDGGNSTDQDEIMEKTYVALYIHINPGCEYGDQYPHSCSQTLSCEGVSNECCQTCFTTVVPTNETVTGLPSAAPTMSCIDQHNVLVNNMSCAAAIKQFPFYCYTDQVLEACCLSCEQQKYRIKDCEYGDHAPQKCHRKLSAEECQKLSNECCFTCSSSADRVIITSIVPFLIVLCSHILTSVLSTRYSLLL